MNLSNISSSEYGGWCLSYYQWEHLPLNDRYAKMGKEPKWLSKAILSLELVESLDYFHRQSSRWLLKQRPIGSEETTEQVRLPIEPAAELRWSTFTTRPIIIIFRARIGNRAPKQLPRAAFIATMSIEYSVEQYRITKVAKCCEGLHCSERWSH